MSDESTGGWRYLLVALLVFALLGADMASVIVAKLLDGRSASDPQFWSTNWYATAGGFLCSVLILLESAMVVALIALFQRAGEKWARSTRIPWGAIGLALSWGAAHLGTHPEGAVVVVLAALIYGTAFTLAGKSAFATLGLVYVGFVL